MVVLSPENAGTAPGKSGRVRKVSRAEITADIILPRTKGAMDNAAADVEFNVCKSTDAPPSEIIKDTNGSDAVRCA